MNSSEQWTNNNNRWIFDLNKEKLCKILLIDDELASRISDVFLKQLQLGIFNDSLQVQMILEEVRALEGRGKTRTNPPDSFKGKHLLGLHKKHFYQTSFIGRNLQNEWKLQSKKSGKLRSMVRRIWTKNNDPQKLSQQIASEFVKALSNREHRQDLDGEWIIFAKWNSKNYYLTLASHKEEDEEIRNRVLNFCMKQFVFANEILISQELIKTEK